MAMHALALNIAVPIRRLGGVAAPKLNNISIPYGTFSGSTTLTKRGQVQLTSIDLINGSGLPFVDVASGPITSWSVGTVTCTQPTHWQHTVDIPAGRTPGITAAGFKTTAQLAIQIIATGPGGSASAVMTMVPDATATTIGDSYTNYDYEMLGQAGSGAYGNGLRKMFVALGIARSTMIAINNSFAFTSLVTVQDADPARPSRITGFSTGGSSNIDINGLTCAGYNSTSYLANIVLQGTNISATNCKVLDTEYTYNSGDSNNNNFAGFVVQGASTTATITFSKSSTFATTHKYRGIILEACTSCTVYYGFFGFCHAQGVWMSPNAKNITFIEPIILGIFRTRYYDAGVPARPLPDTYNHQEPMQVGDGGNGVGTDLNGYPYGEVAGTPLVIKGGIFAPLALTNSGGRGLVLGGSARLPASLGGTIVPTSPGQVIADGIVSLGWIADMLECYGFGAGSRIERVVAIRCDVGDKTWAASVNDETKVPGYDVALAGAKVTIAPDPVNLGTSPTLAIGEIYVENQFVINATALAVATNNGHIYQYSRGVMTAGNGSLYGVGTADPVGFAAANPKTALETFFNGVNPATVTWQQIRDGVAAILNRPDGKGPFSNVSPYPWRYT